MSIREWVPGAQVGELVLDRKLGAGAMGVVFLATHPETGGRYAIKALPQTASQLLLDRFEREGRAQAAVDDHPNVLRIRSSGQAMGCLYLVMDVADGGDLEQRLKPGALPPLEAAGLVVQLARGLEHVHRKGVLHRDLKPSNVLFDQQGVPKLVDFGIARLRGEDSLTKTGDVVGTPAYMSPEQVDGRQSAIDERADVYGLGALLYHCLAGQPPFQGSAVALMNQVLNSEPVRPRDHSPEVPPDLERVCLKAMSKSPEGRYVSAGRMAADLERVVRGEPLERPASRRGPLVLVALALLLGMAGAGYAALRPAPETPDAPAAEKSAATPSLKLSAPRETTIYRRDSITLEGRGRGGAEAVELQIGEGSPSRLTLQGRQFASQIPLAEGLNRIRLTPLGPDDARGEPTVLELTCLPGLEPGDAPGELRNVKDGSILIRIEGGTFTMGMGPNPDAPPTKSPSPDDPFHRPHQVTITRPYYIGKLEVTWAQYRGYLEATGQPPHDEVYGEGAERFEPSPDHPVAWVSWEQARRYCEWAGLRLPTEAEWELAARGEENLTWPWGNEYPFGVQKKHTGLRRVANLTWDKTLKELYDDGERWPAPVGSYPEGNSPFGCLDMAGNVNEWVFDHHAPYPEAALSDPKVEGAPHVFRGGSYYHGFHEARTYARQAFGRPGLPSKRVGIRVARDAK